MSGVKNSSAVITGIKIWIFPSLVTILAMMIWRDVNELRTDVKQLLAESNSNKAKVENLDRQVQQLNQSVFKMPKPISSVPKDDDNQSVGNPVYAILNKEQDADIKKYVPYKTN